MVAEEDYLILLRLRVLSWFDKCNNQDHLSHPHLAQPQCCNIGSLRSALVLALLSFYDCVQPAS